LTDADAVGRALALVEEARALLREPLSLPLSELTDVAPAVDRAQKGGQLEPRELVACSRALFAFIGTRDALEEREHKAPRLAALGRSLPMLERLARRVGGSFDANGELLDSASEALREAREKARAVHRRIKARLDKLLHDERFLSYLREGYYTLRNGRYVVPVNAQHQAEVPGIIHNASQTGQTLFIEPEAMIGVGNELAIVQSLVLEEERRVLNELSGMLGDEAEALLSGLALCAQLDEAEAAARLAEDLTLSSPQVEAPEGKLVLRQLRHPLLVLQGRDVVANDVLFSGEVRAMVISGPNAGGKTVTLKAVGLSALMLRAGLPIPADEGSVLPLYTSIHSAVGDAQDLSQGLSTFSAHVLALKGILDAAGPGSLALIDEIAADTDPREGAALATSVLQELLDKGARVLVTTHLEEVKALTHVDSRFLNARVGFDAKKMLPTFRLQLGAPGASSALDVAARMGLAPHIIERARAHVLGSGGALAQALAAAEADRRRAAEELERAQAQLKALEQERRALDAEREAFDRSRREAEAKSARRALEETEAASREVASMVKALEVSANLRDAERVRVQLRAKQDEAKDRLRDAQPPPPPAPTREAGFQPAPGKTVFHQGLGRDVEVLERNGDEALVAAGGLKVRARVDELYPARGKTQAPRAFPTRDKTGASLRRAEAAAPAALGSTGMSRCDVRGMRGDEALREVEGFLDRAFEAGDSQALILHGHGSGKLREQIREYLAHSAYVRVFRPGESHEGGNGVTLVTLAN
jgi:DNA mismatch repair protein MutS2